MLGTIIPWAYRVITLCNADGVPAMTPAEIEAARFETGAWAFAWFGFVIMHPFGDVEARMVDPANPRQYAPGDGVL